MKTLKEYTTEKVALCVKKYLAAGLKKTKAVQRTSLDMNISIPTVYRMVSAYERGVAE